MVSTASTQSEKDYQKMIETPVSKLILKLAGPTVISMLVTSVYNMADTFFVSKISTQASAAVGIVFPIMTIIQSFGFTLGMGSASLISRKLGEQKNKEASIFSATAFYSALFIGLIIAILGLIFSDSLMKFFGASSDVLPYAESYASFIFYGAPLMCASFVMNNILRSEGKSFFSMIALATGGVLNIILDPVFIFGLKLGIKGAAIATLVSQSISFFILLSWFLQKKTICSLLPSYITKHIKDFLLICSTGLPSLTRQGLASVAAILLNREASFYSDGAVAAMSIVTKIVMFIASIMIGIGQGFTPVAGYNYGAKRFERVKKSYWFTLGLGFFVMLIVSTICGIFAEKLIASFRNDSEVINIGVKTLRFQLSVMPLHAFIVATNMLLQATGKITSATFLSCNRQGIYFIPAILLLPRIFGINGMIISQTVSDFLTFLTSIPFLIFFMKQLKEKKSLEN